MIRVVEGDWGAPVENVAAVACSAAASFPVAGPGPIVLEPTPGYEDAPITLIAPTAAREIVVRVNVRGMLWARLAFQFAHEYCHALAGPSTFVLDRLTWVEEVLCEVGSLFALRAMSRAWPDDPPYVNWRDYAPALASYAEERLDAPAHRLPPGTELPDWLEEHLPALEADPSRREDNAVVAGEILPLLERDPTRWEALRFLHLAPRPHEVELGQYLGGWAEACPAGARPLVTMLADRLLRGA